MVHSHDTVDDGEILARRGLQADGCVGNESPPCCGVPGRRCGRYSFPSVIPTIFFRDRVTPANLCVLKLCHADDEMRIENRIGNPIGMSAVEVVLVWQTPLIPTESYGSML